MQPVLYIVIPCYNEEAVLPITAPMFLEKLDSLFTAGKISADSRVLFVDDGSKDRTWEIISDLAAADNRYCGIRQSRNRGHQNAVLAGLMEAKRYCDVTISIDCDGQDDINAMDQMLDAYENGSQIVYGVRNDRRTDSFFKRFTAQGFYRLLKWMGADTVYNHADYRLVSKQVLDAFSDFKEVNIFLRGMFPLVGFQSTCVYYARKERIAGKSHYPLAKMLALAFEGITSLSTKPLRFVTALGCIITFLSLCDIIWFFTAAALGTALNSWIGAAGVCCLVGGMQLICLGVVGAYVGKIYLEVKARPRYIISERTNNLHCKNSTTA